MKCVVCKKGETKTGKATVTLEKDGATLVFKGVPARVCSNCGEEYVDQEITARLLQSAQKREPTGSDFYKLTILKLLDIGRCYGTQTTPLRRRGALSRHRARQSAPEDLHFGERLSGVHRAAGTVPQEIRLRYPRLVPDVQSRPSVG